MALRNHPHQHAQGLTTPLALFIAPYIQLVFGVETAVRGARTQFSIRPKWTVTTCLGIVVTFLLLNLFVAVGNKAPDYCFASLFWIIEHYAGGCFALFLCIEIILIIVIVTIFVKLSRSYMVDPDERMAASRMIYYLSLGFISNVGCQHEHVLRINLITNQPQAFIIPYFFSLTFLDQSKYIWETLNLSMVASVVSNVNGLMVAGLHLFLRSQNNSAIGHNFGGYEPRKSKYDPRDSSHEHRGSSHSMQPVTGANDDNRTSSGSFATLQHAVEAEEGEMGTAPTPSSPLRPITRPTITIPQSPRFPEPTRPPSAISPLQIRKQQSYSLFPSSPSAAAPTLPATAYSPVASKPTRSSFRPPPVVKPWLGRGHRRDSSIESSATVQIGIRLSNVDDFQNSKVSMDTIRPEAAVRPSPLAQVENRPASNYIASDVTPNVPRERPSIRDARNKTLPPVPTMCEDDDDTEAAGAGRNEGNDINGRMSDANQPITLGPSVYRPEDSSVTRSTSNRSVNRSARMPSLGRLRMSAALASRGTSDRGSVHAPPRPKGSAAKMVARMTKADWI